MTLFDRSLKLALFFGTAAMVGCLPMGEDTGKGTEDTSEDTDTNGDTDTDSGGDTDTDTGGGGGGDTGFMQYFWYGNVATDGAGSVLGGGLGYGFYGFVDGEWLCTSTADWADAGSPAPAGCPGCDWTVNPVATTSTAVGDYCTDFGSSDDDLVGADGYAYWTYPMGFAASYDWVEQGVTVDDAVFLYIDEWFVFAFNYSSSYYWVYSDGSNVEIFRPGLVGDGYGTYDYYYAYYYRL